MPARVRLAHRLRWGSAPYRHIPWPRTGKRPGWPWTWLGRGGPYTQRDLEKGTIETAPKVEPQEALLPECCFTGQDSHPHVSIIMKGRERSKHLGLKTPNKFLVRCLLSSQGAQGESLGISFQQNQKRICVQRAKISLDLASPPQICCSFPRECRDW